MQEGDDTERGIARRQLDLNDVRLLLRVVENGSYTAASRVIGIPVSTISQRIAALEATAGTGLLRRTSRSMSVTETGSLLLEHARGLDDTARLAEQVLFDRGHEVSGTLRVAASFALAQFALAPLLPRFLAGHPKASIQVDASNEFVNLITDGYDVGLRAHGAPLKDSSLVQRVVARSPWSLAAAPSWLGRRGMPASPVQLHPLETLYFSAAHEEPHWTLCRGKDKVALRLTPRLLSNDMATLRQAAIDGGGVVGLPRYVLSSAVRARQLAPVLPDWTILVSSISVLMPPKRQSSRLARLFVDFLAHEVQGLVEAHGTTEEEPQPAG
jgi:DNA-binding transcriptional LysR family regulator